MRLSSAIHTVLLSVTRRVTAATKHPRRVEYTLPILFQNQAYSCIAELLYLLWGSNTWYVSDPIIWINIQSIHTVDQKEELFKRSSGRST